MIKFIYSHYTFFAICCQYILWAIKAFYLHKNKSVPLIIWNFSRVWVVIAFLFLVNLLFPTQKQIILFTKNVYLIICQVIFSVAAQRGDLLFVQTVFLGYPFIALVLQCYNSVVIHRVKFYKSYTCSAPPVFDPYRALAGLESLVDFCKGQGGCQDQTFQHYPPPMPPPSWQPSVSKHSSKAGW